MLIGWLVGQCFSQWICPLVGCLVGFLVGWQMLVELVCRFVGLYLVVGHDFIYLFFVNFLLVQVISLSFVVGFKSQKWGLVDGCFRLIVIRFRFLPLVLAAEYGQLLVVFYRSVRLVFTSFRYCCLYP